MGTCYNRLTKAFGKAVLRTTHNHCFGKKIRKIIYPCVPQFSSIKVGFKGVFMAWTCFPDVFAIVFISEVERKISKRKAVKISKLYTFSSDRLQIAATMSLILICRNNRLTVPFYMT